MSMTIADICAELGEPYHRVRYAIRARRIRPSRRVGHTDLYERDDVELIAASLRGASRVLPPAQGEVR